MAELRYQILQNIYKVIPLGTLTLPLTNNHVMVFDLSEAPYAHGIHNILCALDLTLTGNASLVIAGNDAADGSGTDTVFQTMTIPAAETKAVIELPAELIAHHEDRAADADKPFLSLVIKLTGTATDTAKGAILVNPMEHYDGLTPNGATNTVA